MRSILGDTTAHSGNVADGGLSGHGLIQHLALVAGVVNQAGGNVRRGSQDAIALHAVGGQGQHDGQAAGGLTLLSHDVGSGGAVGGTLAGHGHRQRGSVGHDIASQVSAGQHLAVQAASLHNLGDALTGDGLHGSGVTAIQIHLGDGLLGAGVTPREVIQGSCHNNIAPFFCDDTFTPSVGGLEGSTIFVATYFLEHAITESSGVDNQPNGVIFPCKMARFTSVFGTHPTGNPLRKGESVGADYSFLTVFVEKFLRNVPKVVFLP